MRIKRALIVVGIAFGIVAIILMGWYVTHDTSFQNDNVIENVDNADNNVGRDTGRTSTTQETTSINVNDSENDALDTNANTADVASSTDVNETGQQSASGDSYDKSKQYLVDAVGQLNEEQDKSIGVDVVRHLATYDQQSIGTDEWVNGVTSAGANLSLANDDATNNLLVSMTNDSFRRAASTYSGLIGQVNSIEAGNPYCSDENGVITPVVPILTDETTNNGVPSKYDPDWVVTKWTKRTYLVYLTQDQTQCYKVIRVNDDAYQYGENVLPNAVANEHHDSSKDSQGRDKGV